MIRVRFKSLYFTSMEKNEVEVEYEVNDEQYLTIFKIDSDETFRLCQEIINGVYSDIHLTCCEKRLELVDDTYCFLICEDTSCSRYKRIRKTKV